MTIDRNAHVVVCGDRGLVGGVRFCYPAEGGFSAMPTDRYACGFKACDAKHACQRVDRHNGTGALD